MMELDGWSPAEIRDAVADGSPHAVDDDAYVAELMRGLPERQMRVRGLRM